MIYVALQRFRRTVFADPCAMLVLADYPPSSSSNVTLTSIIGLSGNYAHTSVSVATGSFPYSCTLTASTKAFFAHFFQIGDGTPGISQLVVTLTDSNGTGYLYIVGSNALATYDGSSYMVMTVYSDTLLTAVTFNKVSGTTTAIYDMRYYTYDGGYVSGIPVTVSNAISISGTVTVAPALSSEFTVVTATNPLDVNVTSPNPLPISGSVTGTVDANILTNPVNVTGTVSANILTDPVNVTGTVSANILTDPVNISASVPLDVNIASGSVAVEPGTNPLVVKTDLSSPMDVIVRRVF